MIYIDPAPNSNGAYPNPKNQPFPWCITLSDEQAETFFQYNGFVTVTQTPNKNGGLDVAVEPNKEAWEAWKASLPAETEPEPTDTEVLNTLLGVTE